VVVSKDLEGELSVEQTDHMVREGAAGLGAVGLAVGLFAPPLLAATALGAAVGAGAGKVLHHKTAEKLGQQAGETIPLGGAGLIVAYSHSEADKVEAAVTRAVQKAIGEAEGSHVQALKGALEGAAEDGPGDLSAHPGRAGEAPPLVDRPAPAGEAPPPSGHGPGLCSRAGIGVARERRIGEKMTPTGSPSDEVAAAKITERIQDLGDWRGETLARVRRLIHEADPEIQEEWKWEKPKSPGVPVWSRDGGVCTGESYKQVVKLTFFRGASIEDPGKLFNSSLQGNTRRAIDLREGETLDEGAFKQLIRAAVAANSAARAQRAAGKK
jgi:uncharacterized membrane protein